MKQPVPLQVVTTGLMIRLQPIPAHDMRRSRGEQAARTATAWEANTSVNTPLLKRCPRAIGQAPAAASAMRSLRNSRRLTTPIPFPLGTTNPQKDGLRVCYPCHYTPGYIGAIESGKDFHVYKYEGAGRRYSQGHTQRLLLGVP